MKQSFELLALCTALNRVHSLQDALRVRRKNFLEQSILSRNRSTPAMASQLLKQNRAGRGKETGRLVSAASVIAY
jgi:hypothetical protein